MFVLILFVLSGCSGRDSARPASAGNSDVAAPAQFDDQTGGIDGMVTDDQFLPIVGAEVGIPSLSLVTQSDPGGRFSFSNLPPGDSEVFVGRLGYQAWAQTVKVEPGQSLTLEVKLLPLAAKKPSKTVLYQQGLFGCGTSWRPPLPTVAGLGGYSGLSACGILGDLDGVGGLNTTTYDRFLIVWNVNVSRGSWDGMVMEMEWTSTQAFGKGLTMVWELYPCYNVRNPDDTKKFPLRFASVQGRSPLWAAYNATQIRSIMTNSSNEKFVKACGDPMTCTKERCSIVSRIFSSPDTLGSGSAADLGITTQQPVRQALTLFFNQPVPKDYSAFKS